MTSNLNKSYDASHTHSPPSFSRERENLLFEKGDKIAISAFPSIRPAFVTWKLSHNMVEAPILSGTGVPQMDNSVLMTIPSDELRPGFYDLRFSVHASNTVTETGMTTFAYELNKLDITGSKPDDFEEFWYHARMEQETTPLNPKARFVRSFADEEISKYNVENAGLPEKFDPEGCKYDKVELEI